MLRPEDGGIVANGEQQEADLQALVETRPPMPAVFELTSILLRVCEIASLFLAAYFVSGLAIERISPAMANEYINAVIIAAVFYAGLAEVTGVYDVDVRFSLRKAWGRVLTAWAATAMFLVTLAFLLKVSGEFSRVLSIVWVLAGGVAICMARALCTFWLRRLKRQGVFNQRVAIFGASAQGIRLAKYIQGNDKLTIDLVGFFDDRPAGRTEASASSLRLLGNLNDLVQRIREGHIDQVIVALPWSAETRLQDVVNVLAITPIRIRLAPDLASFAFSHQPVVMLGDLPVMTLFERPISGFDHLIKKAEDFVIGTILTILLLPVFAVIALAIKLDSPGPVFFRQPREGFNNQSFSVWKFRSMRNDHCELDGITQATKNDPRVTRVGAFLRRSSLDELPQLFNVILGEMSVVGPRPHAPSTRAGDRPFAEVVATYAARHKVKPGITGWAQVCGWRGETDTEEKLVRRLEHDLYYIENWSVFLDLYILIRTIPALASSRAY